MGSSINSPADRVTTCPLLSIINEYSQQFLDMELTTTRTATSLDIEFTIINVLQDMISSLDITIINEYRLPTPPRLTSSSPSSTNAPWLASTPLVIEDTCTQFLITKFCSLIVLFVATIAHPVHCHCQLCPSRLCCCRPKPSWTLTTMSKTLTTISWARC